MWHQVPAAARAGATGLNTAVTWPHVKSAAVGVNAWIIILFYLWQGQMWTLSEIFILRSLWKTNNATPRLGIQASWLSRNMLLNKWVCFIGMNVWPVWASDFIAIRNEYNVNEYKWYKYDVIVLYFHAEDWHTFHDPKSVKIQLTQKLKMMQWERGERLWPWFPPPKCTIDTCIA